MLRGSVLGGNIGGSLLDRADEVAGAERVVVEISSFQLERLPVRGWFDVSVLLNVRPNHIDWHGSFGAYARAKARVVECTRAEGWAVLNAEKQICDDEMTAAQLLIYRYRDVAENERAVTGEAAVPSGGDGSKAEVSHDQSFR